MFDVFELQKKLVENACPSGSEHLKIAPLLMELAKPLADKVYTDALGNVIAYKKGQKGGKKVMYAAHMDAIGFMARYIDEKGFIWFDNIGGFFPIPLNNVRVRFMNGVHGIIKMKKAPTTMEMGMSAIRISDFFIDIGANDQKEAEKLIAIGDVAVYETTVSKIAGNNILGPYADDLIACVVLLLAMEQVGECHNDLYFVFTSQEEVGCRGAQTAAYGINPDVGFACDVTDHGDAIPGETVHMPVYLGKGPTIKIKDGSVICNPQLNEKLRKLAKQKNIPWQDEVLSSGGTDTCMMQSAREGVPATCVSIPTRNIHSPGEIFNIDDVQQAAALLAAAAHAKY